MELTKYFKSVLQQDKAAIVICNLQHEIIYMNPAAISRYSKRGGEKLLGRSLLDCHNNKSNEKIKSVIDWFGKSCDNNIVYTSHNSRENKDVYMVALRDDSNKLIGYYEKHEYRKRETAQKYDLSD